MDGVVICERTAFEQTYSDLIQAVLEILVVLPKTLHILHGDLDSLLVRTSHCVHLLLLFPGSIRLSRERVSIAHVHEFTP